MAGHIHLNHLGLGLPCIPLSKSKSNITTFNLEGGGGGGGGIKVQELGHDCVISVIKNITLLHL